jgi:hypothetical protein
LQDHQYGSVCKPCPARGRHALGPLDDPLRRRKRVLDCPWHPMTTACDMLTKTAATYFAARHGRLDCLQYAHENGSPETTYVAALNTQLACLKYIYEFCGDEVSWEASELEGYGEKFSAPIRAHLKTVEASWRAGENLSAANIKPARRNQYTRSVCNYFVVYYSSVGFDFMASCCKTTSMAAKLGHLPCLQALPCTRPARPGAP